MVLPTDQAREAATHFHQNDKYQAYSYDLRGLVAQEYRSTKVSEPPVNWNMDTVWQHDEQRERNRWSRLKEQYGMGGHDAWGALGDRPQECMFYDIDPRYRLLIHQPRRNH